MIQLERLAPSTFCRLIDKTKGFAGEFIFGSCAVTVVTFGHEAVSQLLEFHFRFRQNTRIRTLIISRAESLGIVNWICEIS